MPGPRTHLWEMHQMERKDGLEVAASSWQVFALGALAPLGPYAQVHLAPKIPPGVLNTTLVKASFVAAANKSAPFGVVTD